MSGGREFPDDRWSRHFSDVLDLSTCEIIRIDKSVVGLTENEAVLLGVLAQTLGQWKRKATLAVAIYGGHGNWRDTWSNCIANHISLVRPKIVGCSFALQSDLGRGSLGYRLVGHLRVIS